MGIVDINRLAWDLEHREGLVAEFRRDLSAVLGRYRLTGVERAAIATADAHRLLAAGVNPVVLRNLLVIQGIAHREMYAPPADPARPDNPPEDREDQA